MKLIFEKVGRFSIALLILSAFATSSFGQKLASDSKGGYSDSAISAVVAPVKNPGGTGNPNCATLNGLHVNGSGDIRFSQIITNNELKLDFSNPNGTFPFSAAGGTQPRELVGPSNPNQSVTITSGNAEINSWSSTMQITAVIMKLGADAYVYPYKPFRQSDTDLDPSDVFPEATLGLSHVTFCFGEATGTTSGDASITGRVVDQYGNGIAKAQMVLVNGSTGETRITRTSPFGHYTFTGLDVNELYVINASHKRFAFTEKQRVVILTDDVEGQDFIADMPE